MCLSSWTLRSQITSSSPHIPSVPTHIWYMTGVVKMSNEGMNGFINHKCHRNVICLTTCVWYKLTGLMKAFKCRPCSSAPVLPEAAVFSAQLHFLRVPLQGSGSSHAVGNGPTSPRMWLVGHWTSFSQLIFRLTLKCLWKLFILEFSFLLINYFNWRLITLQYCSGFAK